MAITRERKKQLQEQDRRIGENLGKIRNRLAVFSGKGGVGKTTVAVNLSYALLKRGHRVGLLDADITGPNVPQMLGLQAAPLSDGKRIIPMEKEGLKVISIGPMVPQGRAVIWRGPLRSNALAQFLADVRWGELDFLLADLPPGTGDEVLTTAQKMLPQMAVVVTTPQDVALLDARRAVDMAQKLRLPHIGVVENMAGLRCPQCGYQIDLFGSGGGGKMAQELGVQFLGRIPIEVGVRKAGDSGRPSVLSDGGGEMAQAFTQIAENIDRELNGS